MKNINALNYDETSRREAALPAGQFTPPAPPKVYVPRRVLLDIINTAAEKRFIHMNAPAGSGKTISALIWLNSCGRKQIWIGLDEFANIPQIFYRLLAAGICSVQPDNIHMKKIMESPLFASSPVESTIRLISELMSGREKYALVLDDMHLISNSEILRSLSLVLRSLPYSFIVLSISRGAPPQELTSLFSNVSSISAKDLVFSENEIREYFDGTGKFLTPEEVRLVYRATGGLPIGVNAVAKSRRLDRGNPGGALENYVKDQLWERWDKSLCRFMLDTCVVDELTAELASRLTGTDNGGEMLDRLCAANYFISRTGTDSYRYHPLFLEFLRKQARTPSPEVYRTVGDYYFDNDIPYKALTYYIKSGNLTAIIKTLDKLTVYDASLSVAEHLANMVFIDFESLAEYVRDVRPYIFLRCAWKYYLLGDSETMCIYFDKFYTLKKNVTAGSVSAMCTVIAAPYLDHRKTLADLHKETDAELIDFGELGGQINLPAFVMNMPFAHRSNRDVSEHANDIDGISTIFSVNLRKTLGNLYEPYISLLRAGLYYEKNMLNEAENESMKINEFLDNPDFAFCYYMIKSAEAWTKNNKTKLCAAYNGMEKYINDKQSEYLLPNYLAVKTKNSLYHADEKAAKEWFANYFVNESEHLELYKIHQHFTTVRAYIVLNNHSKAMRYILRLKRLGKDFRRPLDIAEAGVLQSVLEWALGKKNDSVVTLEDTLAIIQPYGFINIVANEGASILPILKRIAVKIAKNNYQGTLTAEYIAEITRVAHLRSKNGIGVTANVFPQEKQIKLSARQKQMLVMISQGIRNAEIAEITGLSVVTVKRHLTILYAKLEANGSSEAIIKARDRGLVE